MSEDLNFYVRIDPTLTSLDQPAVAFGTFEVEHPGVLLYDSLAQFYLDLLCGRPWPLRFVTRELGLPALIAITLFLDRRLALDPKISGLVAAVSLVEGLGAAGLAHIDRDLARLLRFLEAYLLVEQPSSEKEKGRQMLQAVEWLGNWVREGKIPTLPREPEPPRVLDHGTNGFVVAQTTPKHLIEGLIELYRQGFLRGVLYAPSGEVLHVLAFRKSPYLQFDLEKACGQLNAAEGLLNPKSPWKHERFHLVSPREGSRLPMDTLTQVFIRI